MKWSIVTDGDYETTWRMAVQGGWIYKAVSYNKATAGEELGDFVSAGVAMVFVPCPSPSDLEKKSTDAPDT